MGPVPKTILAICILAGSTAAALTFRREPSRTDAKPSDEGVPLPMRGYIGPLAARPPASAPRLTSVGQLARPAPLSKRREPAASGGPWIAPNQPPPLARAYPEGRPSASTDWRSVDSPRVRGNRVGQVPPAASRWIPRNDPEPLIHAIVNGDTLEALAERYLGRADRAEEIFAANRTRLHDPEILPIGIKLTIPRRVAPPTMHRQPLVPVAAPRHDTNQHAPRPSFRRY